MKIIIGLGNPGGKYKNTRHNAGFMLLDKIIEEKGLAWKEKDKWQSVFAENNDAIYVKPMTYMNNSGEAVRKVIDYYKLLPKKLGLLTIKNYNLTDNLTVIHDEIDLPLGKYKTSLNSRSAGHRGVDSVINHLKTKNFKRIRIGVMGDKPEQMPMKNYVLSRFQKSEIKTLKNIFENIISEK
ncbi:MAG: aminoacyl-tRNA hydrolase [Patescibacteria group bacterium]|nr:aminoacyl-tRNA hydrolase [Patescibacteria group bacterium]